jgi:hypothetical protein
MDKIDNSTKTSRIWLELNLLKRSLWILVLLLFGIIYFSTILWRNLIFYYTEPTKDILWDLGFELVSEVDVVWLQNMPQWFAFTFILYIFVYVVVNNQPHLAKDYGLARLFAFLTTLMTMHWIRAINYHSTRVSSPTKFCMELTPDQKPQSVWELFYKVYNKTCGDLIFSGHNANLMIIFLGLRDFLCRYFTKKQKVIFYVVFVFLIVSQGYLSIITRR